jgi:LPXTG-motif cell wall-anchored protein
MDVGGFGGAAQMTPWGAGIAAAAQVASTPNANSQDAGGFFGGSNTFGVGNQTGGSSGGIPTWAIIALIGVAALFVLRR